MLVLESLTELERHGSPRIAITFGNFDGVHHGHQVLIKELVQKANSQGRALAIVTFVPHPRKILKNAQEGFLLGSYQQRQEWLRELGVAYLIELSFTRDFSTLSASEFLTRFVFTYPNLEQINLGWDFAFGANKQGDADVVRELCKARSIDVVVCPPYSIDGLSVSSTEIRRALQAGDIPLVKKLLGRDFTVSGLVVRGEGRGKRIGIPTANLQIDADLIYPSGGVYVTETTIKDMTFRSVTNVGVNPTFKDDKRTSIETHLIDFDGDLYGEQLRVKFLQRLRSERKFSTVNELIEQVKKDIEHGRNYVAP